MDKTKEKPLSEKKKREIREFIAKRTHPEENDFQEVIRKKYHRDEEAYLRAMAKFHGISLN